MFDGLEPALRRALWQQVLRDEAIAREWIVGLGQRSALERLAHLACKFWTRMQAIGLADQNGCEWKLTQSVLGDVIGLSSVHVNRTLQALRTTGLAEVKEGRLHILHHAELAKLASFDPTYLGVPHVSWPL